MKNLFKLDLRSLALVRFFLGLAIFFDIFNRLDQIDTFYSDFGILPRWLLIQNFQISWKTGLFTLIGDPIFVLLVSLIGMISAIFLAIGLRTRLSLFVSWLVIISFQARFPEVLNGGDVLFRLILFIAMFLPLNAYYSVDSALSDTKVEKTDFFNTFTVAWFFQIFFLYSFTFYYKLSPTWLKEFNSIYYALSLDKLTTPFGQWLLNFPMLLKVLSFGTLWLEGLGPLLILIPWRKDLFRSLAILGFAGLHIGIWMTMTVGIFPAVCLILWGALIPSSWWEYLNLKLSKNKTESYLYYDPDCGFCRKFCFILEKLLILKNVKILPASGHALLLVTENKSWVFESDKVSYIRFAAFEQLLAYSMIPFFGCFKTLKFSKWGGDLLYKIISKRRYFWGVSLNSLGVSKIKLETGKVVKYFGIIFILTCLSWNLEGIKKIPTFRVVSPFTEIAFLLQWNQQWNMFSPPSRNDGWFIVKANLEDGTVWDIMNDKEYSEEKPKNVLASYKSVQWTKFFENLEKNRNKTYLLYLGKYLCRQWNLPFHEKRLVKNYELFFMREFTSAPDKVQAPVEKIRLWGHTCF